MAPAPNVEAGFFPLDEELELGEGGGNLSPRLHEWLVRLGAWVPSFEQASKLLSDFARVQVSEATTRRQTEAAGAAYEAIQKGEVEWIERTLPSVPQGVRRVDKQLLSVDGAMVPLLHGQWAEVKTLVLGEVEEPVLEKQNKKSEKENRKKGNKETGEEWRAEAQAQAQTQAGKNGWYILKLCHTSHA